MPRAKKPKLGNCYEAAGKYMMDHCFVKPDCGLTLVHGEVAGQGPLEGLTYGHAWVLDGDDVVDVSNGRTLKVPKAFYYKVGHIDEINNLWQYNWSQTSKHIIDSKHWGPWDLKTKL